MTAKKCEVSSARAAVDALRRVTSRMRDGAVGPEAPSAEAPSAEALDELAQLADLLGRTVEDIAGEESEAVRTHAEQLASAISAHRDSLTR